MRASSTIGLALLLAACDAAPPVAGPGTSSDEDVVASWRGGAISFTEVEQALPEARTPACLTARQAAGGGSIDQLLDCYGEVAKATAIERLVLSEVDDLGEAIAALEDYYDLRRHAYVSRLTASLRQDIEVEEADVAARFAEQTEAHRRPGSLSLWHIFRRHEEQGKTEETIALLSSLRARALAGEPFGELAREYSHSENRLRDGLVGSLREGQLPPRLEQIAFALEDGGVSDPVPVSGGAVLLHVRNAVEGVDLELDQVRSGIRRQLEVELLQQRLQERVSRRSPPPESLVTPPEEVVSLLDQKEDRAPLVDIGGDRLDVAQLRRLAGLEPSVKAADLPSDARQHLLDLYQSQVETRLLVADLAQSDEARDGELRSEAEERLRDEATARVVDERIQQEMWELVDADPEALERYYEDNPHHYQSQLRFKLQIWNLPFDRDPPRQLQRMEEQHRRLVDGSVELQAAVDTLGGTVRRLDWREFDSIVGELPTKGRSYLLQTEAGGFSVPYQQDEALHMIFVEEREEPGLLPYEAVREQVREDYFARYEQRLYADAVDARLEQSGYRFDAEAVRRQLEQPIETDAESNSEGLGDGALEG